MVPSGDHASGCAALRRLLPLHRTPTGGYTKPSDQIGTADDFFFFPIAFPFTVFGNDVIDASRAFSALPAAQLGDTTSGTSGDHGRRHRLRRRAATT